MHRPCNAPKLNDRMLIGPKPKKKVSYPEHRVHLHWALISEPSMAAFVILQVFQVSQLCFLVRIRLIARNEFS